MPYELTTEERDRLTFFRREAPLALLNAAICLRARVAAALLQFVLLISSVSLSSPSFGAQSNLPHGGGKCDLPMMPFCDAVTGVPTNWTGTVFHLSQDYPSAAVADATPWGQIDPISKSGEYLNAVLHYFYDGNIRANAELSFDPARNQVRRWYHAPWQTVGLNGREFIHGLTRERTSRPGELAPSQTATWNNYAVGFYNAPGGYTIGRVWANHSRPSPGAARFPDGTVAAKLIFTTATVSQVPYLAGAPEWNAYIAANPNDPAPPAGSAKAVIKVRLIQIDVAVRDSRLDQFTGWVFGTFVYGGGPGAISSQSGWTNVAPVGIMWGNDPGYSGQGGLKQSQLSTHVHMPHVGFQGRLNGPIDNPASSCLSCHSTAEYTGGQMIAPPGADPAAWFRNIPSGTAFDAGRVSLDYSLQLSVGLTNFAATAQLAAIKDPAQRAAMVQALLSDPTPPRDGGRHH